jgi:hypothetical protein
VAHRAPPTGFDELYSVAATSARDVWAAGQHFDRNTWRPRVERWDGRRWRIALRPQLSGSFRAIVVRSAAEVWFLGETKARPLVRRWDGTSFRLTEPPSVPHGVVEASASTADAVWASGGTWPDQASRPFIARYDCRG